MEKAIFLDRDGVINKLCHYTDSPFFSPRSLKELVIFPHVKDAVRKLKSLGYKLIVVSNQPMVGRGTLLEKDLAEMTAYIKQELPEIEAFYYCTHAPEKEECSCRKPKDGLIKQAVAELQIDLANSIMIGDSLSDIVAGHECGHTILLAKTRFDILNIMEDENTFPDFVAKDLEHAGIIVENINHGANEQHTSRCDRSWRLSHQNATIN